LPGLSLPYSQLTGTPTIPTNTSQLTNDSGFVTSSFSTTSANVWASFGLGFSTTSANYWGGTKGYLTSLAGAASSTLLADINNWIGRETLNGTTTMATTTVSNLNGVIYVDGVHYAKTTAGLQQALNDCAAAFALGCSNVHLMSGTTALTSIVTIPSGVNLEGDGWNTIFNTTASSSYLYVNGNNKTTIRNLLIDQANIPLGTLSLNFAIYDLNASDLLIDHVRIKDAYSFGLFTNTTAISGVAQRITIQNSYLNGRGNADVIGGGSTDSTSTVKIVIVKDNVVVQDASQGAYYDGGIDECRSTFPP
jgi:hypothetical protein